MAFFYTPFETALSRFGDLDQDLFPFTSRPRSDGGKSVTTRQGQQAQSAMIRPRMDWVERDGKYVLTFEMPALKKEDVDISLHDNLLTVSGKTSSEREEKSDSGHYIVSERRVGSFSRSIAVTNGLKPEELKASMENGLLRVEFPKEAKESAVQKITIG